MSSVFSHGSSSAWAPRGTSHKIKTNDPSEGEVCHTLWAQTVPTDYTCTSSLYGSSTKRKKEGADKNGLAVKPKSSTTKQKGCQSTKDSGRLPPIPSPPTKNNGSEGEPKTEELAVKKSGGPTTLTNQKPTSQSVKLIVSPTSHAIISVGTNAVPVSLTARQPPMPTSSDTSSILSSKTSRRQGEEFDAVSSAVGSTSASLKSSQSMSTASTRLATLQSRLAALENKASQLFTVFPQRAEIPDRKVITSQAPSSYTPTYNSDKDILASELVVLKEMLSNKIVTEQLRQKQRAEATRMGKIGQ